MPMNNIQSMGKEIKNRYAHAKFDFYEKRSTEYNTAYTGATGFQNEINPMRNATQTFTLIDWLIALLIY